MVENVYRWACGWPTVLLDRNKDSDEGDVHDRDYDVAALADNLSQAFRYTIYENDDVEVQIIQQINHDGELNWARYIPPEPIHYCHQDRIRLLMQCKFFRLRDQNLLKKCSPYCRECLKKLKENPGCSWVSIQD
ncbi:unnamed protein product [Fraxinus pennsylvanica]|uniref:Uncharacterized protein n=1 Tax=Fraxinus pennsylvanica TaxID=56036 RepID=A0AAD2EFI6_9LAMI|nr:unnamed protein product [Fraxinus pennsylvanica]